MQHISKALSPKRGHKYHLPVSCKSASAFPDISLPLALAPCEYGLHWGGNTGACSLAVTPGLGHLTTQGLVPE